MIKLFLVIFYCAIAATGFAQTQSDVNFHALQEYKKADQQLNETYQQILTEKKTDSLFVRNLKKAQKSWVQLRDAQLALKFPPRKENNYYQSVQPMLQASFLTEFTLQRIDEIRALTNETGQKTINNSCSGVWYGEQSKESSISILLNAKNSYTLLCKGPNGEWEGLGYGFGKGLIAIFQYTNIVDKGYFTLTITNPKRAEFSTYDSDGGFRSSGILVKE